MNKFIFVLTVLASMLAPACGFAGDGDDQGENDDDQGGIVIRCPPTGCIQ